MSAVLSDDPRTDAGTAGWMAASRERAEAALDRVLPPADAVPRKLHDAMRYATLGGGKRVRAMLVYAAGEWAGSRCAADAATALDARPAPSS